MPGMEGITDLASRRRLLYGRLSRRNRLNQLYRMSNLRSLLDHLARSKLLLEFQRAFSGSTGLPLNLRPLESWELPLRGAMQEGAFCALMCRDSVFCARCLQTQGKVTRGARDRHHTILCDAGMLVSVVPVRVQDVVIGFLHTGQVFQARPTAAQFQRIVRWVRRLGLNVDELTLKKAYFETKVFSPARYQGCLKLLSIFAKHLSLRATQIQARREYTEPPIIARAKEFVRRYYMDTVSLPHVAAACGASPFYFCKLFKKVTGRNFVAHVTDVRVDKAKSLLSDPTLLVSSIAYEVGFQSVTHFNRVFKTRVGKSPTDYRRQLRLSPCTRRDPRRPSPGQVEI